jgi:hypothetical protein
MKSVTLIIACALVIVPAFGEDVSDILNQISSEKEAKKQTTVNSTAIQPVKASEPTEKRKETKKEAPKAKTKKVVEQPKLQAAAPQAPRIIVYRPKDKLPKDVAGAGVAGVFVITGEDVFGGAILTALEDNSKPFARQFTVQNISSGYPPGTKIPQDKRRTLNISPDKPLIFVGHDVLPGFYILRAQ